ncbi:putative membrane protein YccC [Bradyrhizobium diazoefficiens]
MTVTQASTALGHVVVVEAHRIERIAEQADVGPTEDLPDGADDVPGNQQRQREDDEAGRDGPAVARHRQRNDDAERHLDGEDHQREEQIAAERREEAAAEIGRGIEQLLEPADAVPEELVVAERVLHRIVHHRHQRQHRREGDDQEHRQHQEPGFLVDGLVHQAAPSTRRLSA